MSLLARPYAASTGVRRLLRGPMTRPALRITVVVTALLTLVPGGLLTPRVTQAQNAERVEAVQWARDGDYDRAITRLYELHRMFPDDAPITADLATILQWAGRDQEALDVFDALGAEAAFDYTLIAVARAARATKDLGRAERYLLRGAERFPGDAPWDLLRALVYVDGGRFEEARRLLIDLYGEDPVDVDGLLARGYLAAQSRDLADALRFYTEVVRLRPENREALAGRILALEALGGPFRAEALAQPPPDLLNRAERTRIAGSQSAMRLQWGRLPVADPRRRFDETDRAIAVLEGQVAEITAESPLDVGALQRARLDLLVAYRDRVRMADAVSVYQALQKDGITVPAYARLSAAAAYLYLERPEIARDLYQSVVDEQPRYDDIRLEAHLGLFYSLIELERYRDAYAVIDALDKEQALYVGYRDTGQTVPNDSKLTTSVTAALARFYGGQLAEAWDRLSPMAARAPAASWLQSDTSTVARARGWSRRALEMVRPWLSDSREDPDIRLNYAASLFALRRYPEAEQEITGLYDLYPENKAVQNLKRELDVHNMWEWITRVEPSYGAEPDAENFGLVAWTRIWTPPIADYFRVTASYRYASQDFPEGRETYHRTAAGLEYKGPALRVFGEVTYNESTEDRVGGRAEIEWTPTDELSLSATGEIFSQETPLRALVNGTTANLAELGVGYTFHESTSLGLAWRLMDFSDGNTRNEFFPRISQRVIDWPLFTVTAMGDFYASTNTKTDVAYFSPESIFTPTASLLFEHVTWRRYRQSFVQALTLTVGGTWQKGFDGAPIGAVAYEHRWQFGPQWELTYGVLFASRVFDGDREQEIDGFVQLNVRF
jgi:biofilm PGA synthesis protein PgaA